MNFARQVLDLSIKIYGADSEETAIAYGNLGRLYYLTEKRRESVENYEKALEIYKKDASKNELMYAGTMQKIGAVIMSEFVNIDRRKLDKAEEMFTKSLGIIENRFGAESRESLPFLKSLLDFYIYKSKDDDKIFETTRQLFVRYYTATAKNNNGDQETRREIDDIFFCFLNRAEIKDRAERKKQFEEATKNFRETSDTPDKGVVNGIALRLEKPSYPNAAKAVRAAGSVMIRVQIDEQGSVTGAKAFCGHPLLRAASEQAAAKTKFKPTLIDGKPVKVAGIVVYNFIP